jgi:hypothetical protein
MQEKNKHEENKRLLFITEIKVKISLYLIKYHAMKKFFAELSTIP